MITSQHIQSLRPTMASHLDMCTLAVYFFFSFLFFYFKEDKDEDEDEDDSTCLPDRIKSQIKPNQGN